MNLEHLHTLVCIVEHGSLSAAARVKRISQPAVTKQVQRMEAELGLALLVRGPKRGIRLTPAGERYATSSCFLVTHSPVSFPSGMSALCSLARRRRSIVSCSRFSS